MKNLRDLAWLFVTALSAWLLVTFALSYLMVQPWHVVPELGGDGAKNVYTYLYHSVYGSGYWFTGMNYPYGEHIVYTDGQPMLSMLLNHIQGLTLQDALTVAWRLIGFSYILSIIFLFLILRHFRLRPWLALLFACLIGIFSPQIIRIQGHYALSYTCFVPMLFFWTLRYRDNAHWRYGLYIFSTGCIAAFLHPYYAAMMLIWATTYSLAYLITVRGHMREKLKHIAVPLGAVAAVLAVVAIVMKVTDPVTDRPETPYNTLYETCTRIKQLVTSYISPVWQPVLKGKLKYMISDGGEGYAYLGLVILCCLFCALLLGLRRRMRQKQGFPFLLPEGFSPVWLWMAGMVLLFSMGVPFIWRLDWLMNYLAIFKQFRSLGRFSWIFYYLVAIYAAVFLNDRSRKLVSAGKRLAGYGLLAVAILVWAFEASGYINYTRTLAHNARYSYDMMFSEHEQNWPSFLEEHHSKGSDFQALLLLPYFHVGTEKLWVGYGNWLITLGAKAGLQLHLPIIDVMMSRSSWSQAEQQVKLVAGPFVRKPILSEIKTNKPFLTMVFDGDTLSEDQGYLLRGATYLGHYSQCFVYAVYPDSIRRNDQRSRDSILAVLPYLKAGDTVLARSGTCFTDHFDAGKGTQYLFGTGGLGAVKGDTAVVADIPILPHDSVLYELSCWLLVSPHDPRAANIVASLYDDQGRIVKSQDLLTRQSVDNVGMWFRTARYFYVARNIRRIRCVVVNEPNPSYLALDELQLRPASATIISKAVDGKVMVNNHPFNP